jgi:hypothetical protein
MLDLSGIDLPNIIAGALVSVVIGWAIWITKWVIGHNKACHSKSNEEIAKLRAELDAAKVESRRIADNYHDLRDQVSPVAVWFQLAGEGRYGDPRQFGIKPPKRGEGMPQPMDKT